MRNLCTLSSIFTTVTHFHLHIYTQEYKYWITYTEIHIKFDKLVKCLECRSVDLKCIQLTSVCQAIKLNQSLAHDFNWIRWETTAKIRSVQLQQHKLHKQQRHALICRCLHCYLYRSSIYAHRDLWRTRAPQHHNGILLLIRCDTKISDRTILVSPNSKLVHQILK